MNKRPSFQSCSNIYSRNYNNGLSNLVCAICSPLKFWRPPSPSFSSSRIPFFCPQLTFSSHLGFHALSPTQPPFSLFISQTLSCMCKIFVTIANSRSPADFSSLALTFSVRVLENLIATTCIYSRSPVLF